MGSAIGAIFSKMPARNIITAGFADRQRAPAAHRLPFAAAFYRQTRNFTVRP
jgi:hypothetical protein